MGVLGRRNGLAGCPSFGLRERSRFVGRAILDEVQFCLDTMLDHDGFSACQIVFDSNSAELHPWQDDKAGPGSVRSTPISRQFTSQWKLREMAEEAMLITVRNGRLRRVSDRSHTPEDTDCCTW